MRVSVTGKLTLGINLFNEENIFQNDVQKNVFHYVIFVAENHMEHIYKILMSSHFKNLEVNINLS